jgi:hypothetical protein
LTEYIEKQVAIDAVHGEFDECLVWDTSGLETANVVENVLDTLPPADVVSWAYLERYAEWFCADVTFPEFIREAKAFLKASCGFQEGNEIYD